MPLAPDSPQILNPEQANPYGYGMLQGANTANTIAQTQNTNIQNQWLGQQLRQNILATQLQNEANQAKLPYVGPGAAADVAKTQSEVPLNYANAAYANAEAKNMPSVTALNYSLSNYHNIDAAKLAQMTPYQVAAARAQIYNDPVVAKLYQLQQLQQQQGGNQDPISSILSPQGDGATTGNPNQIYGVQNASNTGIPFATGEQQAARVNQMPRMPINNAGVQNNVAQAGIPNTTIGTSAPTIPSNAPSATQTMGAPTTQQLVSNQLNYGTNQDPNVQSAIQAKNAQNVQAWGELKKNINNQAKAANSQTANINQIENAYKSSNFTGPILGDVPVQLTDSARQELQKGIALIQQGVVTGNPTGDMTDKERINIANTLPQANYHSQAFFDISDFLKSKLNQVRDLQGISTVAYGQNIDPTATQAVMQQYMDQRPVYDFGSHTPLKYKDTYQSFIKDPNVWQSAATGIPYVKVPDFGAKPNTPQYQAAYQKWYANLDSNDQQYLDQQQSGNIGNQLQQGTPSAPGSQPPQGGVEKRGTTKEGRTGVRVGGQWYLQ